MKTKLIQTKDYLLLTDEEAKISKGNYVYSVLYGIGQIIRDIGGESTKEYRPLIARFQESEVQQEYGRDGIWQMGVEGEKVAKNNCKKIVACYPLTKEAKELDLPVLPNPFERINVKEQLEYFIEDCLKEAYPSKANIVEGVLYILDKAAQPKQFSLEDIKKAIKMAREGRTFIGGGTDYVENGEADDCVDWYYTEEEIIQSLTTQQLPKEFVGWLSKKKCPYDFTSRCTIDRCDCEFVFETITNSEGRSEVVGVYKY